MGHKTRINRPNSRSGSLGQFLRSRERFVHVSIGPFGMGGDGTYNVGRNAAKRAKRAESKALRAGGAA